MNSPITLEDDERLRRAASTRKGSARPRVGFLGVGWIGRHRMQGLVDAGACEVAAVVDRDPAAAQAASELAGGAPILPDEDALLRADLDGIVIATPSAQHAAQAISALRHGKAVMCQKPLGRDVDETRAVLAAARAANRRLMVDLSYRYVAGVAQMRELVQSGALGEVFAVEATFHNAYGPDKPWFYDARQSGGGCLVDLGTHLVDLVLWITGSATATVVDRYCRSRGRPLRSASDVEDWARARLELPSGAAATITCSWNLHAGCDAVIELELYGTGGGVALRNVAGSFYDFRVEHRRGTSVTTIAESRPDAPDPWGPRATVAWAHALARDPGYDPANEEVVEVARIIDAIYERPAAWRESEPRTEPRATKEPS
jgi:predicted dehydrogenase